MSYGREIDDAVAYLLPLARNTARVLERKMHLPAGELSTVAMIATWHAVVEYDAEQSTSLWLFGARRIKQRIVDEIRNEYKRVHVTTDTGAYLDVPIAVDHETLTWFTPGDSDAEVEQFDDRSELLWAMGKVRPKHRLLLELIYLDEVPLEDIAHTIGVSTSAVSRAARYAVNDVRSVLGLPPVDSMLQHFGSSTRGRLRHAAEDEHAPLAG
jgi:RNA polymerase sigma factor (sigma-70 family)